VGAPASIIGQAVVPGTAAGMVAKGVISAWDKAFIQLLPFRRIACAVADEYVLIAHYHMLGDVC
jgi:hypothetical protein